MALHHLGKDEIASLTENSTEGRACNFWFSKSAEEVLEMSNWTFARKIASLAQLTNDYSQRWEYKYDRPSDCLKFIRLVPIVDPVDGGPVEVQMLGTSIYSNEVDAAAEYVYPNLSTTSWPSQFSLAVSLVMARNMAMKLTRKGALFNNMHALAERAVYRAVEYDANQEVTYWTAESDFLVDRNGGPSTNVWGD